MNIGVGIQDYTGNLVPIPVPNDSVNRAIRQIRLIDCDSMAAQFRLILLWKTHCVSLGQ